MPDPPYTIIADPWFFKNKIIFMSVDPGDDGPPILWTHIDELDIWGDRAEIERRLLLYEEYLVKAENILNELDSTWVDGPYREQLIYVEGIQEKILDHRVRLPGIDC